MEDFIAWKQKEALPFATALSDCAAMFALARRQAGEGTG